MRSSTNRIWSHFAGGRQADAPYLATPGKEQCSDRKSLREWESEVLRQWLASTLAPINQDGNLRHDSFAKDKRHGLKTP